MRFENLKYFLFALSISFLLSCEEEIPEPVLSSAKVISSFSISGENASINESDKTISLTIIADDFTALVPTIAISDKASVSPASEIAQDFTNPVSYTVTAEDGSTTTYSATVINGIVSFSHNAKNYEIVKESKNWVDAAAFAVERGGILAEIDDLDEQNAIFAALENASITPSKTVSPDGGGASYVWIGGNDLATEGNWIWDGNNDLTGAQFWMGTQSGSVVNDLFNNWGDEPDDFGAGQDALGLAITDWPLGVAGQWNDLEHTNKLYSVIELD
ncbi:MAG: DUF5018 domain-containing protein [Bacteroidia bacterium]